MALNIILAVFAVIVGVFVFNYKKNRRFWSLYYKFRGDNTLPLVGNALAFNTNSTEILKRLIKMWERNGRGDFRLKLGPSPYVILTEAESVELILESSKEITKSEDYEFLTGWLGDGLLLSNGRKWHQRRKMLTPAFHFKILEQFTPIFEKKGDVLIKNLLHHKDQIYDIYRYVTLCTLDGISESAMGVNLDIQKNSDSDYVKAVYKMAELIHHRTFSSWKRVWWMYMLSQSYREEKKNLKIMHNFTNSVIKTRKSQIQQESMNADSKSQNDEEEFYSKKKFAFLDILLMSRTPDGKPLSDEDIREEVDTFMFEGHDTTSSCVSFTMYLLAKYPKIQEEAFLEQFSIFGDDLKRQPTYNDLQNMNYLERVIKESLRIYPAVPFIARRTENDLTLKDGKIIPGDTQVFVNFFLMGNNPNYWKDPSNFNPDRFLPENSKTRNPFLYAPFSAGPRNCIGQKFAMLEIKSLLSKVLRNLKLIYAGDSYEPKLIAELILKSENGINMIIKERNYDTM